MKSITSYMTEYLRFGYKEDEIKVQKQKTDYLEYDDKNRVILEEVYARTGECISRKEYQYNANNLISNMVHRDENQELIEKIDYVYNEVSQISVQTMAYGDDETLYTSRFTYQNGQLVKRELYENEDFVCVEKEFFYEKNLLVKELDYDEDGGLLYVQDYHYNDKKQIIEKVYTEIQAHDKRTYKYQYDEVGNLVNLYIYNYTSKLISEILYQYNSEKLLIQQEEQDGDGYRKQRYFYNEHQQENKIENIDKDGKIISYTENAYNDQKELILQRNYVIDEVNPEYYRIVSEKTIQITE